MGYARLNVWIGDDRTDPCRITSRRQAKVFVTYCDHKIVVWCDREQVYEAQCGHVDIWLPPGCYIVFAELPAEEGYPYNRTYPSLVTVDCDNTACVRLYPSTLRELTHNLQTLLAKQQDSWAAVPDLGDKLRELIEAAPRSPRDRAYEKLLEEAPTKPAQSSSEPPSAPTPPNTGAQSAIP